MDDRLTRPTNTKAATAVTKVKSRYGVMYNYLNNGTCIRVEPIALYGYITFNLGVYDDDFSGYPISPTFKRILSCRDLDGANKMITDQCVAYEWITDGASIECFGSQDSFDWFVDNIGKV